MKQRDNDDDDDDDDDKTLTEMLKLSTSAKQYLSNLKNSKFSQAMNQQRLYDGTDQAIKKTLQPLKQHFVKGYTIRYTLQLICV